MSLVLHRVDAMSDYSDDDVTNREEEKERKRKLQMKIRKEQQAGPPPNMKKRQLIFDSLSKIISRHFGKGSSRASIMGETRGTYLFSWGAGYHGQLGRQFERGRKKYATIPKMIALDVAIRQISCGGLHSAAVTDSGQLYTWGDARCHQLGYQPHGFTNQPVPHLVDALENNAFIVSVSCGQSHTVCLTDKGSLISFGTSKAGQCGHNDRQVVKAPRKIRMDDPTIKFVDVSCGDKHTVALTSKGYVFSFGCAQQGQLGHDESPPVDKLKPTEIKSLSDAGVIITSVVAGSIHTCMVSDEGEVYVCGFGTSIFCNSDNANNNAQGVDQNFFYKPVPIPFHEKVVSVACGQSHILALTDKGDVYAWGEGSYGQLGQGVKGDLNTPRLILTGKAVAQVAAGRYHSVALTSFGTLYAWGCGENGQLGHHTDENVLFPKVLEPNIGTVIGQVACGEHHTAVLTSTPWNRADPEVMEWLQAEREEYQLKLKFIKRSNHGLVKKDLLKIQEKMSEIKAQWYHEKQIAAAEEREEHQRDIASVRHRSALLQEIMQERVEKEAGGFAFTDSKSADDDDDRPESAKASTRNVQQAGAFSARPATSQAAVKPQRRGSQTGRFSPPSSPSGAPTSPTSPGPSFNPSATSQLSNAARCSFLRESSAMVRRMKSTVQETGDTSSEARLKKTVQLVFHFRKDYDTLRNLTRQRVKVLESIQRKVNGLKKNNDSTKSRRRINELLLKALKMKLSTVTIKITETEENRKNYALNIAHLKEEELERYYQLEALRKQVAENENFSRRVNEMRQQAIEEKERSEQELADFRYEILNFHHFLGEQLSKFHAVSSIAQQRKEKRELEKFQRSKKTHEKINLRISRLNEELEEKTKEQITMQQQLSSVNERLRYFEKRFQQIASATGLTNPDAIINKFTLKEEIKQELNQEIKNKQAQLAALQARHQAEVNERAAAKNAFQESKWKDVDALYKVVHDSQARATQNQMDSDRLNERLAYFREGILSLLYLLPPEFLESVQSHIREIESSETSHDRVMQLQSILSERLNALMEGVMTGEGRRQQRLKEYEAAKRLEEQANQARIAQEIAEKMKMSTMMRRTANQKQQYLNEQEQRHQEKKKLEQEYNIEDDEDEDEDEDVDRESSAI